VCDPILVAAVMLFIVADRSANDSMKAFGQEVFATASITPTTSGTSERGGVMLLQPGGGFTATNATLRELVAYAYQRHPRIVST
jgi:hypothetical protein